ncbi:ATP-binding cassette domain-containing protein [Aeromicrobium sp. YIM 150415]|uniref:ATP-binding cassette domain-containing protein n=1 Tax=Aeromicrobium piscarium TaxID=2590901 RepID=A0A554SGQ2_9ACTN|nr:MULTISPECIES: ATP-binding cassette domain-containing protein [Aeromicrobium]MBM9462844.1 ATP-binding cassette domain-containing protein [Aeromicrobium sp. YIM 150415]TSD65503.1 ATP-binding cassette domain-containing protein [Aeromicrobium piscarium]
MTTYAPENDAIIEFDRVEKTFPGHRAVENLDFTISRGELVSVVGVTGCGKSTMFNLTLGLFAPTRGTVQVQGHDPYTEFDWFRRKVAVVFQDARLLPWRTALQNVCVGMKFAGIEKERWEPVARDWLERLGLAGRENSYPHQLSGGQRQRVSLARAFAVDPELILCDESFSALDEITAKALRAEFVELVRAGNKTGVVITHNIAEALSLGNRVLVMRPPGHLADDVHLDPDATQEDVDALRQRVLRAMDPGGGDTVVGTPSAKASSA